MIIRFRGKHGTLRVDTDSSASFANAVRQLESQLPSHAQIRIARKPNEAPEQLSQEWQQSLESLNVRHGDLFFYSFDAEIKVQTQLNSLDEQLDKLPGQIKRPRSSLCKHGTKGMCEYCQPLEPFDPEYHMQQGIKHLSYHAHLRQLMSGSSLSKPLVVPNYSVDMQCKSGHAPYPQGICSNCQPPAVTLKQQRFRLVDHVEFANSSVVNNFIQFWRATNTQRIGFLIGEYQQTEQVPLGIKAVVHAIYEPRQANFSDGLNLEELPDGVLTQTCGLMNLEVVGFIFTDLEDAGKGDGSVVCKRHAGSYFLSSLEVVMAAKMQTEFPNKAQTRSSTGTFSSRFVTCVVSGNLQGEIEVSCYQVSLQAEALVRANLVVPSTNPSVMRVLKKTPTRYVPDVFYKHLNEYNLEVREEAQPSFPVDYLIVSLSHGFPDTPNKLVANEFPIENREALRAQTIALAAGQLELAAGFNSDNLRDFHLLRYIVSMQVLHPEDFQKLTRLLELEASESADSTELTLLATELARGPGFSTMRALA